MNCTGTSRDRDTCQGEKMGCTGCGHNDSDIEQMIKELTEVNPSHLNEDALRLFKTIMKVIDERDYYKSKYEELK